MGYNVVLFEAGALGWFTVQRALYVPCVILFLATKVGFVGHNDVLYYLQAAKRMHSISVAVQSSQWHQCAFNSQLHSSFSLLQGCIAPRCKESYTRHQGYTSQ